MQALLGFLVAVGIFLQIQVRYVYGSSYGYYLEPVPSELRTFANTHELNNPEGAITREHRSIPQFYGSADLPYLQSSLSQYPHIYESGLPIVPHLSVRRSVPKTPKQKEQKPQKPVQTTTALPSPVTEENIDADFLKNYALDLDKVAYNTAKYVRLSATIVFEHVKSFSDIIKLSFRHMIRKIKLLLRNPLQLLFLPFSFPVDLFKFTFETAKFGLSFMKHVFQNQNNSKIN